MATTNTITTLDSTYLSLINYQIQMESQPLTALQAKQSALKLQRAVYADLKTKLESLRTGTKNMISTDPFYTLNAGRTITFENVAEGSTVLSASVSKTAIPASYEITDISLALADRVRSDEQEYADQALSKEGTIYIGGSSDRSVINEFQAANSFGIGEVAGGYSKLSNGNYFIETREVEEVWQFRLVNASGDAQTIEGSGENGWQAITSGLKDTGRGLTINFGSDPEQYIAADRTSSLASRVNFSSVDEVFTISSSINTITNMETEETLDEGQRELGKGTYFVETRKNTDGAWQFRLVDSEGIAASIKIGSTDSYSTGWQAIPTGAEAYSTGRGLKINFGSDPTKFEANSKLSGAPSIQYQAKGAAISITTDMSLNDIASAISSATYASGDEVIATVVNKQLVLNAKSTGAIHKLQASGEVLEQLGVLSGSSFAHILQSSKDASFKVNGLTVSRSKNAGLTDVINGVTLNLMSDAEGKSATLNVATNFSASKTAINSFITNFNAAQTYLSSKLSLTKQADGTYLRGQLSGDQSLISLRNSLFSIFSKYDASGGLYKSLRDIGVQLNGNLTASVVDSAKLDKALQTNFSDVQVIMDRVMTEMTSKLDKFTGTTSYVDQRIKATELNTTSVESQITTWNKRIEQRKASLTNQYTEIQSQMTLLSYTESSNSAWITSLYSSMFS